MTRPVYFGTIALLCLIAAGGIVALIVADGFLVQANLIYTALGLLLFGVTAVAGVVSTARTPFAWLGWVCVLVAVTGFGLLMGYAWSVDEFADDSPGLGKAAGTLLLVSFALADVALMLRAMRTEAIRAIVALTSIAVVAIAVMLSIALIGDTGSETYFRIVAIVAVLWALGTALVPVLRASEL
jgi:hypothetical protein